MDCSRAFRQQIEDREHPDDHARGTQLASYANLPAGTHSAQVYLYTTNATHIYNFHIIYQQFI